MLEKIKSNYIKILLVCSAFMTASASYAPVLAGVTAQTADTVSNKVVEVLNGVLMPIGGVVIFVTVVVAAFKIISTANKPNERADAMSSLPYIVGGGILLGGALMASGLIYGLMQQMHGTSGMIFTVWPY